MALGAIMAIEGAGLVPGKDIIVTGIDAIEDGCNAVKEGKQLSTVYPVSYTHLDVYKRQLYALSAG